VQVTNSAYGVFGSGHNTYSGAVAIPATVEYDGVAYTVTRIGTRAFFDCAGLTSLTLPEGITTINVQAFNYCTNLPTLNIPASVKVIRSGNYTFVGCSNLTFTVAEENTAYKHGPAGELMSKNGKSLFWVPEKLTGEYTVPDGVETISGNSICKIKLTKVVIPASVKWIGMDNFLECPLLTDVVLAWSDPAAVTVGNVNYLFESTDIGKITLHVPAGTAAAYGAHPLWGMGFKAIVEQP
jgi:hypothetical protein